MGAVDVDLVDVGLRFFAAAVVAIVVSLLVGMGVFALINRSYSYFLK